MEKAAANGWRCHWCGLQLIRELVTADHVKSIGNGGDPVDPENIVPSCYACNHNRDTGVEEFAKRIEQAVFHGAAARKLIRLAVQHDQLVAWLAEVGSPLSVEMRAHLMYLGDESETPAWPKHALRNESALKVVRDDNGRAIALRTLAELYGITLPEPSETPVSTTP